MEIKANVVTVDEGAPVVIGFADDGKNPANYLLLQYDAAEPGVPLHVELNDQQQSGYDLIKRIQLLDSSVVIELTRDGENILKSGSSVTIRVAACVQNWQSIKLRLATLLQRWL